MKLIHVTWKVNKLVLLFANLLSFNLIPQKTKGEFIVLDNFTHKLRRHLVLFLNKARTARRPSETICVQMKSSGS